MESIWLVFTTDYDYSLKTLTKESQFELGKVDDKCTWFYPLADEKQRKRVNAFGLTLVKEMTAEEVDVWKKCETAFSTFKNQIRNIDEEKETFERLLTYPKVDYPEIFEAKEKLLTLYDTKRQHEFEKYYEAKKALANFIPALKEAMDKSVNVAYAATQNDKIKLVKAFDDSEITKLKDKHYSEQKSFYPTGELKTVTPYFKDERHGFVKNYDKNGDCISKQLYYFNYETREYNYQTFKKEFTDKDWDRVLYGKFPRNQRDLASRGFNVLMENLFENGYLPVERVFKSNGCIDGKTKFKFAKDATENDYGFFINAFTSHEIMLKNCECFVNEYGYLIAAKPEAVKQFNLPLHTEFFSLTKAQSVLTGDLEKFMTNCLDNSKKQTASKPVVKNADETTTTIDKFRESRISSSLEYERLANDKDFAEFVKLGGTQSGIFNISDEKTRSFVEKYSKFIFSGDVYAIGDNNTLQPVFVQNNKKDGLIDLIKDLNKEKPKEVLQKATVKKQATAELE